MRAALAGDEVAYRTLLGELAGALRVRIAAALRRAGRGNAELEDIVQEALLAVHLKRHHWDPALPFGPWVNAIARYKMIDAMRRQGLRNHADIDDLIEAIPAPAEPEDNRSDVERLLVRLEPRAQRIVRAISIEERTAADVAAELGMNEGAVRVALHRALKALAALYRGEAS